MKGLILAGGLATRLRPLTWVTNKHLLPIYNKPMIYYPIEAMAKAGVKEVLISSSPDHSGDFANLLKDGEEFGLKLYYAVQQNPKGGIANAIALAEEFVNKEKLLVILGGNWPSSSFYHCQCHGNHAGHGGSWKQHNDHKHLRPFYEHV
jgi:glucose-1-phosphate thymidylyltransferase